MLRPNEFRLIKIWLSLFILGLLTIAVSAATGGVDLPVSQKGRKFNPVAIELQKGGALMIVNDDGDLLHHVYIESPDFNFDSGDQKPGSHTRIVFPVAGDFKVLCGIHPKMRLAVHVD